MKKLIVPVVCATLAIASAQTLAFGGKKGGDHRGGKDMIMKLHYIVDLSDEQKVAIRDIKEQYRTGDRKEKKAARKGKSGFAQLNPNDFDYDQKVAELADAAADKTKQRVIKAAKIRAAIHALLTPEQQAKLEKHKQERSEKRAARLAS